MNSENNSTPPNSPALSKRTLATQVPAFITIRTIINTMVRMIYPFLPIFGRGLGVDLQTLSAAITLRALSGIFGPFLASIADSKGRRMGMFMGLSLSTLGVGLAALWPSYPTFVAMLILGILGNFVFIPSMQAHISDKVPYNRRGLILALTEFSWSLSFIVGVPLVGLVIASRGWTSPFPILTLLGIMGIISLLILIPKDPQPVKTKSNLWRNLGMVFTYPPALAGILLGINLNASNEVVNVIFGVWMEDSFGVKVSTLAIASAIIGLSEFSGETLVSVLIDRFGKRRSIAVGLILNGLVALALPIWGRNLNGALVGLFLLYICFEFTIVSCIPLMTEILPTARATLMAVFIATLSLGRALGAFLAPYLYASHGVSNPMASITRVTLAAAAFNLVGLIALRFVKEKAHEGN